MHCIHSFFSKEQIPFIERLSKNLTCFSVEDENYSSQKNLKLKYADITKAYADFSRNIKYFKNKKIIAVIPPFSNIASFYENYCEYLILRLEGKRKYYKDNMPDITLNEIEAFTDNYKGNRNKILIEISGMCKDCNITSKAFSYMTLNQAKLKKYITGSKEYLNKELQHNYYTYLDENEKMHIVWLEDNTSISSIHNLIKDKKIGGIHWKNPANVADGNWEAMNAIFSHLRP